MKYKLLDIGIFCWKKNTAVHHSPDGGEPSSSSTSSPSAPIPRFKHDGRPYIQLHPELNIPKYLRDIVAIPEYELCEWVEENDPYTRILSVFLQIQSSEDRQSDGGWFKQRQRVASLLFEEIEESSFIDKELKDTADEQEDEKPPLSIQQFYEQLRLRHRMKSSAPDQPEEWLPIPLLRPELRAYQEQAIRWMVKRETNTLELPSPCVRLRCHLQPKIDFYMDPYTYIVTDKQPEPITLPPGGILADEMGLGKTVEMLGLMLLNKKHEIERGPSPLPKKGILKNDADPELRCLCFETYKTDTIECRKCRRLQHRKCVLKHHHQPESAFSSRDAKSYICPECWRKEPLVESGATIIVSPVSIKHQWVSEIRKHVSDPNFRIFVYNGIADKWISPRDLASYDVVLTDYNVLRPEIYLVPEHARTSRHEKRRLAPSTPLTQIHWWRVCLDEAQMVEGVGSNVAKMVKALPAVHRWAVTGTPIEKTIDNLYGLVQFLDYEPYALFPVWRQYSHHFQAGNANPLLTMMERIMWRTCKHAVLDQLGVPPQSQRIHHIQMSDLQSYFYRCEHNICAAAFAEKARRIGAQERMAKMDLKTLNQLLEPLRKLRQDCTIPSILSAGQSALQGKKLLTPSELHEHLVTTNINDCKGELRSMVSSLNGMAAILILQQQYDQAFFHYRATLRCAADYQGAISVDSLLQIHALHNLLDLVRSFGEQLANPKTKLTDVQQVAFEKKLASLEWRYIEQYASKVRSIELTLRPAIEKVDELIEVPKNGQKDPVLSLEGHLWRALFALFEENPQRHGNMYCRVLWDQTLLENTGVKSWRTLDLWLLNWLDKLINHRNALVKSFQSLDFFVEHLQPNQTWPEEIRARIDALVRTAFACHLDPALFEEDENGMRTDERITSTERIPSKRRNARKEQNATKERNAPEPCLLCKVKDKLNQLEAVLFLIQQGTRAATGGLWQVSRQEQVLKMIHQYGKRHHQDAGSWVVTEETITESDHFMSFLERVKVEFKEYSQYWVEINYTVAAYDELGMCKSRLQLITEAEQEELQRLKKKRSPLQLLEPELPSMLKELQVTRTQSERQFVRLKGTLKYLEHLGAKKELDPCPVCQNVPEGRYGVLQCGHHLCSICLIRIIKMACFHGNKTSCVICRHQQHVKDIQYVQQKDKVYNIRGSYANKIAKIVQTVLELVANEPTVKIVIFSHWEPILSELGVALTENDIKFREKSVKFFECVEDFKHPEKGITCLLLPLRYGSKGLNLTEATHVFLVEPILNPGEEMQAIGRVHRIGQTKPTFVHRFIMLDTIETKIHDTIQGDRSGRWLSKDVTVEQLAQLFLLDNRGEDTNDNDAGLP